jgi:ABC-type ATPase with predicted acetyltransferase domain
MKTVKFHKGTPIKDPVYGPQITYNVKHGTKKVGEIHQFTSPISKEAGFEWVVYDSIDGKPVYHAFFLEEAQLFCEKFIDKLYEV